MTLLVVLTTCVIAACSDSPTAPSTTTTTTVPDTPLITEEFHSTVDVGGARFYSFVVGHDGTVNVTLTSVSGAGVPPTVWMGLGIGTPDAEDCATTSTVNGPAGSSPQLTGTYAPGIYCVKVWDLGNLFAPARFTIVIEHR